MPRFSWAPLLSSLLILTPFWEVPYLLKFFFSLFLFFFSSSYHIILLFRALHIKNTG